MDGPSVDALLVGGEGCHTVLRREAMLSSRILIWQHFTRLTPGEVLETIPLFHPIWAAAAPDDITSPTAVPRTATSAPGRD